MMCSGVRCWEFSANVVNVESHTAVPTVAIVWMLWKYSWKRTVLLRFCAVTPVLLKDQVFVDVAHCQRVIFFHWHYSPLWALACRTMFFHFFPICHNSLHLLTPSTWRSLSTSSFHLFLSLPLLVLSRSWVKIFLGILSSSILSRWRNQLILCPFIHFTIFSPLLISSSSRFVRHFHSPFSYLGPYILLNIFLSKISRVCSSFFVNVHAFAPYDTTGSKGDQLPISQRVLMPWKLRELPAQRQSVTSWET